MFRLFLMASFVLTLYAADAEKIARGKYLVEVGQCGTCHTPKKDDGTFDETRLLKGAVLDIQPLTTIPRWHKTAPDLTPTSSLWKKWGEGAMYKYLQTGLAPSGRPAGPPMPQYKMTADDADAVIQYLKSLK
jgi:mono/diheme cytochrome c family protein